MFSNRLSSLAKTFSRLATDTTCESQRFIKTSANSYILSKDIKGKKSLLKESYESKLEGPFHHGHSDQGLLIPNASTPSWEIDGVRFDELPIVHIRSSPNNTVIHAANHSGTEYIANSSCGMEGFRNVKKSTTVAAQATALSVGLQAMKKGVKNVRVVLKGIGAGRLPAVKGLQMAGLNIVCLSDRTPLKHSGPRSRKAKRI